MPSTSHGTISKLKVVDLKPTAQVGNNLQDAYDFFNKELFGGKLPPCIILLHRKKGANGYFWAERFGDVKETLKLDEIALNPTTMRGRSETDVLSTLVHEMCHLEEQHFGKPPKGGYHGKAWGKMMKAVGLLPQAVGKAPGVETGTKVSHTIEKGGKFEVACKKLLKTGLTLPFSERRFTEKETQRAKAKQKVAYQCDGCDAKVWGKPGMNVVCGDCDETMEEML
jgi:predicted SprT family Zn-dependent metalloprotease